MKENEKFYSSLGLLILLNAVIKPLWIFGIDRQVQNTVGSSAYGTYFSLLNLSIVFNFLLDLGFTSFLNRQLAARDSSIRNNTGLFLSFKVALSVFYLAVLYGIAILSGIKRLDLLFYVALTQVALSFFLFLRTIITANQWFTTDAWLSVLDKTVMILCCGALLYFPFIAGSMSIERFLLLQLICTSFAIVVSAFILFRKKIDLFIGGGRLPFRSFMKDVVPFALIVLLMSAHSRLDGFLLERMNAAGAHEAGVYAASYRLLDASNMIGFLFASFLLPYISRQWSEKKDIAPVLLTSRHLLLSYSITISCICIFLAPWLQQILYHHNDARSAEILQWCMPALLGYSLTCVYGTVLTATGRITAFNYITLAAVLLNVSLNIILIPSYGAKGCCIAAFISQGMAGITAMIYVNKGLKNNIHAHSLLIYIFTGLILSCFLYTFHDWTSKWILMIAAGMITAVIMITTRLFDLRQWSSLVKKR